MVGVEGLVVRTTVATTENITTDIAPASPTPCQPCPMSRFMGSFHNFNFSNSELDSRAPGGTYYSRSYCANTVFGICTNTQYEYFGGGGGGIGASVI